MSLGMLEIASSGALWSTAMVPRGLQQSLSATISVPAHLDVASEALPRRTDARRVGDCFDFADLVYESVPQGLKETIVLEQYAGSGVFSFDVLVDGVEPSLQSDGSILFCDDAGKNVFRMPAPYMWDSREATQGSDPVYSDDVHYEMTQGVLGWRIDIVASSTWLEDPARVYPVHIDPTFYADATAYPTQDTHARSFYPTTNYGSTVSLLTGYVSSYGTVRTFIKPTDPFFQQTDGITVIDADLKMYADIVRTPPDTANLCLVTSNWSESALTWNLQPTWSSTKDTRTFNDDAWVNFQVADEVNSWIQGTQPNYGFMVWSTATTSEYTLWSSSEAASNWPRLVVRYAVEPTVELVSPNLDVPAIGTPFAEWQYSDLAYLPGLDFDKEQVCYTVELASVPGGAALWSCTESTSDTRCEITYQGLTPGTRYWVRVRAAGGTLDAAHPYAWSDWTEWQPFWYRSADDVNDQAGVEVYRAADEVASGVWVDLPSGSLRIARSEWSGPSL